jgi:hypothetical protein
MWLSYLNEHYGDVASVVGLILTLVGFVVTIWNVRKAKQAAEGARQAAREAVSRIGSQILANEIGTTLELVRQTDATCRERNWSSAMYRCDEARIRLVPLIESPELRSTERDNLHAAFENFGEMLVVLQALLDMNESKKAPPRIAKQLHKILEDLGQIKSRLQTRTLEI